MHRFAPAIAFTPDTATTFIVQRSQHSFQSLLRAIAAADGEPLPALPILQHPFRGLFHGHHDYPDAAAMTPDCAATFAAMWADAHATAHASMPYGYVLDDGSRAALQYKRALVAALRHSPSPAFLSLETT